jgi:hypothetical protein
MSWHYSRVMEAEYSAASSVGFGPCAPSKSTTTPAVSSWPGKMTDACQLSLFGTTCELLTVGRGVEWWTSSLAASRARTSASLDQVPDLKASAADSGEKCGESLAKWDRNSYSWKTHRRSRIAASTKSSVTWPRWGMMRDGECWEQSMPERLTEGNASGLWPTPLHSEARQGLQIRRPGKKGTQQSLTTAVRLLPTPTVQDAKNNGAPGQQERNMRPLNAVIGGSLNPQWVEWLMGWPGGWTDLAASATDRFRQWCASHGIPSPLPAPSSLLSHD